MIGTLIGSSLTVIGVFLTHQSNNKRLIIQLHHENNAITQENKIYKEKEQKNYTLNPRNI